MSRRSLYFRSGTVVEALLVALVFVAASNPAGAGVKTRRFTFENGTVGNTASTALNSITGPFKDVPDDVFGEPFDYYDVGPAGVPNGTLLGDFVATSYDSSPDFTKVDTAPTYVNVSNGSPLDSPAAGSTVGLQFNGTTDSMTSQGFRGTFISDAAVANNDPADDTTNVSTSFTAL